MDGDTGGKEVKRIDRVSEWSLARVFVEGMEGDRGYARKVKKGIDDM